MLMLDLSMSMPMEGRFVPAKKVAMALQALIAPQFPRDYLGVVVFSETARVIRAAEIPEASWDYVYGTNMHHALTLARQLLGRQHGSKQIIMVTDGEPTAHVLPDGEVYFHYPPVRETIEATLREVVRCTNAGIRINTFMLGATQSLKAFVERISEINRGRAFFATPENLGDYVLVDFIEHRRTLSRTGPGELSAHARRRFPIFLITASRNALLRERDVVCDNHRRVITPTSSPRCPLRNRTTSRGSNTNVRRSRQCGKPRRRQRLAGPRQLSRRRSRPVLPRTGRIDARGQGGVPRLRRACRVPGVRPAER